MNSNKLIELAVQAMQNAYVPYSKFKVGCVLVAQDDKIYSGCNVENASYGLTNCAERTTIFKAISEGERCFKKLVVVADTDKPVAPCGACRQVISEFFNLDSEIVMGNLKGDVLVKTVGELLPYSFGKSDLY